MVQDSKKQVVAEFVALIQKYPIIGIVNMEGLPTPSVQKMRETLRKDDVALHMAKKRLLRIILDEADTSKKGISELKEHLKGMPALICAKTNPFKLYKKLEKSKSPAPAKPGQEAPKDIVVPAGPTGFAPGPIIGELGKFGIKAGIDGGKVAIKADAIVAKEGDIINKNLAGILQRLGIEPMEIGLDLRAVFEDGLVFGKSVLAVDEDKYLSDITQASRWAFNLAIEASVFTDATTQVLLGKASNDAKALAISQAILAEGVINDILARAHAQANSIQQIGGQ